MGAAIRGNPVTPRNRKVAFPSHGVGFRRIGAICRDNGVGFRTNGVRICGNGVGFQINGVNVRNKGVSL
jgi:hypothetical protein